MGETVEEDKKGKSKKVKAEKSKLGKKEKRKGSSEQAAIASDNNVDNDEDEAEDIKVDEEEKCLIRIQNYREPVNPEITGDQLALNQSTMSKDHH